MSDGLGTRAVHAGLPAPEHGAPFLPGPVLAAPTRLSGDADPAGALRAGPRRPKGRAAVLL